MDGAVAVACVEPLFDEQVELALERLVDELPELFAVQRDELVDPLVDRSLAHTPESTTESFGSRQCSPQA